MYYVIRSFYICKFYARFTYKRLDLEQLLSIVRKNICPGWQFNPRSATPKPFIGK